MIGPNFPVKKAEEKENYGKFIIEPLVQGYGHTLGNSLRRVLLTSLKGAAVTSVKISGIKHQFSTLPGLKEDIVQLILNIKRIRFRLNGQKKVTVRLSSKGIKKIFAKDLESAEAEIINGDLYLGELTSKNAKLQLELTVEEGYGYVLTEGHEGEKSLGTILVDALFSPVVRANYKVEATRVGRMTDLDKLIIEIWTDGTIKPSSALKQAALTLVGYFKQVYDPKVKSQEEVAVSPVISEEILKMTLEELDIPTRIVNALKNHSVKTVGQLLGTSRKELMKIKNVGAKSVSVIEEILRKREIAEKIN